MSNFFITLCDENYEHNRQKLNLLAEENGLQTISYTINDLDKQYIKEIEEILKIKRGLGLCAWKPHIILETLKLINNGEYVIYIDSADMIDEQIFTYINEKIRKENILLVPSPSRNIQKKMTKRDCFVLMGCDEEKYWNNVQIEAGLIVAKKTEQTIKILEEWKFFCKNINIITDEPNICGLENFSDFVCHRHDQSIMTNLATKYNILIDDNLLYFIRHNVV